MKIDFKYCLIAFIICTASLAPLNIITSSNYQLTDINMLLEEIGQVNTPGMARDVIIRNNIAFIADMGNMTSTYGGLLICNISDPTHPTILGHFYDGGRAHQIFVEEDLVFVADNTGGLEILNISDLTDPVKIAEFEGVINGVYKVDQLLYLSDYYEGLIIVDVTNLTHPLEIASYSDLEHPRLNLIDDNLAYVGDANGLKVLDITTPKNITEVMSTNLDHFVFSFQIVGDLGYMACSRSIYEPSEGLKIWNCTNPLDISLISSFYDGGRAIDLHISEDYVIVCDYNDGLEVINVSDPFTPNEMTQYYDGGNATAVQVVDNLIYVADGQDGLEIIRMTFTTPTTISSQHMTETTTSASTTSASIGFTLGPILFMMSILFVFLRKKR
ncbi:MAG: hypothetical protein JSW11_20565 [Candidatus Heimdallarchaeota archaeon]|nr:MAG: hypothetical protein JSW11_20565 [Candidatus Heimdallarchaeota archaeon]